MIEYYSFKDFEAAFIETEDYSKLSYLINPLLSNFIYKNKRHDSWNKIFKKCSKIFKIIYKNNFEIGFQHKRFSKDEHNILENIFRLMQRIQMFSNNSIDLPNTDLLLPYALCFETEISIQAFKVISLYFYKDRILQGNTTHIEVILKLINLPEIKVKKSLYDKHYTISKTNSRIVEDPFEYFNNNKTDKNISDLYLETHELLCSEAESFIIKNYCIITIGKLIEKADEFLENIKKRIINNNDEMKYLFDEFVFYLLQTSYDEINLKKIHTEEFTSLRLKYDENTTFENISIFSNIKELDLDCKFSLTSEVINPDLDFQYYSGIYHLVKNDTSGFPKCLDLEEYKKLLNLFDTLHIKKDKFTLKIIFKIINETYKKSSAYLEPFEDSQYLKKCINLIIENSVVFSYLCCTTLSYFINHDPLSIPEIAKQGIIEIFDVTTDDYELNIAILNLLDDLSLNTELRDKFLKENIISKILEGVLITKDLQSVNYANKYSRFLKHHPEYKPLTIEFIKSRFKEEIITTGLLIFSYTLDLSDTNFIIVDHIDLLNTIAFILKNNCNKDIKWKDAFIQCLIKFLRTTSLLEHFIDLFLKNIDIDNIKLIEMYLYIICNLINQCQEGSYDLVNHKFRPLFCKLLDISNIITEHLTDTTVVDFNDLKDKNNIDVYYLVWIEINFIIEYIWSIEDVENNEDLVFNFLNLFVNKQNVGHKRTKSNITNFTHTKLYLYNILMYNISNWEYKNLLRLMDWLCINYNVFSIPEMSDILSNIVKYKVEVKIEHFKWITKLLYEVEFDSKILKFYDLFLSQIDNNVININNNGNNVININIDNNNNNMYNNNSGNNNNIYYNNDNGNIYNNDNDSIYNNDNNKIMEIYNKYYTHNFDIKFKYILNYKTIYDKVIEDRNFRVLYDKIDLSLNIIQSQFYDNRDFINLCIATFKYATFNNISIDFPSKLKDFIKSKSCNLKLKMKYILTYVKYMKLQRKEISEIKKIIKFIIRFIKRNNIFNIIKCIIHQIFGHSEDLISYKTSNPIDFIYNNYLVCFYDIFQFREIFKNFLNNTTKTSSTRDIYYDTNILFKYLMKRSLTNPDILLIITQILYNNTTYYSMINNRFIRKVLKRYIHNTEIYSEGYINSLKFLILCLKFTDFNIVSMVYNNIIRKIRICTDYKIYNYIIILYNSVELIDNVWSDIGHNDFTFDTSSFYIEQKITDEIFSILTKLKEADLYIKNNKIGINTNNEIGINTNNEIGINTNNKIGINTNNEIGINTNNKIGIQEWDNLNSKNRISFIYSFLLMIYDKKYEYLLDEYGESEYEEEYESDYLEMYVPENITPECSSTSENLYLEDKFDKPKKNKISNSLCSSYFLCEEEFRILEDFDRNKFIELITNTFKKDYNLENKVKDKEETFSDEINKEEDNLIDDNILQENLIDDNILEDNLLDDNILENNLIDDNNLIDEDESSIGEEDGIIPEISVDDINKMNEQEVDDFIKQWYEIRKSESTYYIPIDKNFINQLDENHRIKFEDSEKILKDDYFLYAPDFDSDTESEIETIEDLELFIDSDIYKRFLILYLSPNWTIQKDFSDLLEILCYDRTLKLDTIKIISEKLLPSSEKELIYKCLQILRNILGSSKKDIGTNNNLIKNILEIAKDVSYTEDVLYILSKLSIEEEIKNEILFDISEITEINLSTKSIEYLTQFCKTNINNQIIEFILVLLDNKDNSLFLIIDLSIKYFGNRKNIPDTLENNIKKCMDKLLNLLDEKSVDYTNLTLFGLYEEFVCFNKQIDLETLKMYKFKREKLELCINDHKEEINDFTYTNDIIIKFLSKFNILNFINKKTYFYSKLEYYKEESFTVVVNRNSVLSDSFFQIMNKSSKELKARKIQIKFSGEQGLDFGGLTKEWLELIIKDIVNPNQGLFVYLSDKKNTMIPYRYSNINTDHLLFFRFIGRILAFIIIDGYNVGVNFDKSIFKYLLDIKCTLRDLEEIDVQYYNSLVWIQNHNIDNILHLTFTIESDNLGIYKIIELVPNGKNIKVTDNNKNEYIDLIINYKLVSSIEQQLSAIKEGLLEMIDEDLINLFNEKELELLICGIPEINVDDWRNNTEYKGYTSSSRNIIWFWKVVEGFTSDEKALLLQFCTGSSRVPYEGFKNLQSTNGLQKFNIHKVTTKRLPTAHTCFNQLDLPEYSTYEELRKKLIYAINECQGGFQLI